jgi:hypothetical protein
VRGAQPVALKTESIHVGDFVYCRSKYYRDQLQLPEELGLVIEIKRSNFKILYPEDKRCWLPREAIARLRPEPDYTTFLQKLHFVLKRVHAHECELVTDGETHRVSARVDKIDVAAIDELRNFLGPGFVSLMVVPEGMAFMQLEVVFH